MKIQYILGDQNKFVNAFIHEFFQHFPFQFHDIIFNRIVPFPYQFNDGIFFFVVSQQYFQVKCAAAKIIPLRMDIIIVNGLGKFKFGILRP